MRRSVAVGVFLAVGMGGGAVVVCAQLPPVPDSPAGKAGAQPKLFVHQQLIELGDVIEDDVVDLAWKIENQGDADLIIQRVQASCGCTVVDVPEEQRTIKPGGVLEIKGQFNSHERPGEQTKTVTIYTNDPREGELRVNFHASVKRLFELRPATGVVHIKNLQRGEASSKTLDVVSEAGRPPVEIVSLTFPPEVGIGTKIEPFTDDATKLTGHRVTFVVKEGAAIDRVAAEGTLTVRVGDVERERKIAVRGTVIGELTIRPGLIDTTRTTSRRGQRLLPVRITAADPAAGFKVLSVDGGALLKAEFEPAKEGERVIGYLVYATVNENAPIGPFGAMVRVKTNSVDQPLIEIPVFGTIAAPVVATPNALLFKLGEAGAVRTRKVVLDASPAADFQIVEVVSDNAALSAAYDSSSDGSPAVRTIEISVTGKLPSGVHEAKVVVATNIRDAGRIEIPVTVIVP